MNARLLLGRVLGVFVLLPALVAYGMGEGVVTGAMSLAAVGLPTLIWFGLGPWFLLTLLIALATTFGCMETLRALRFAAVGSKSSNGESERDGAGIGNDYGRDGEILLVASRLTVVLSLLHWAIQAAAFHFGLVAELEGRAIEPRLFAAGIHATLSPILTALLVGQSWLGNAAAAAQRRSDDALAMRCRKPWGSAASLACLAPLLHVLVITFWRFD